MNEELDQLQWLAREYAQLKERYDRLERKLMANSPRKDREIGSKPDTSKTPIEREVKREVLHPWSKGRTHPVKEN